MVFDSIEQLKREYTDKYVVVDGERPELARFASAVGQVKTVNMNGRALVEFQSYHDNIGWFDIALDYLTVVPKPEAGAAAKVEKPAAKQAAAPKAVEAKAGEKKLSPIEMARMQGAAKAAGAAAAPAKPKPAAAAGEKPAAKPAANPGGKMNTADILAAARAKQAGEAAAPSPAATDEAEAAIVSESPAASAPAPAAAAPKRSAAVSAKPTTTAEIIALCRQIDANRKAAMA